MSVGANIAACHKCDRRTRGCNGPCPCKVDGVDILVHAKAGQCPHPEGPRFGTADHQEWPASRPGILSSLPGPGDTLAGAVKAVTLGRVKMCATCKSRRATMNGWGWARCLLHPVRVVRLFVAGG